MSSIKSFLQEEYADQLKRQFLLEDNEERFRKEMGNEKYEKELEYQQQWINCIRHLQDQYKRNHRKYEI